jgi:hypothetical protein
LSLRTAEFVREVADRLAADRNGFFFHEYTSSMPNDQATPHRLIPVIRATGTCATRVVHAATAWSSQPAAERALTLGWLWHYSIVPPLPDSPLEASEE